MFALTPPPVPLNAVVALVNLLSAIPPSNGVTLCLTPPSLSFTPTFSGVLIGFAVCVLCDTVLVTVAGVMSAFEKSSPFIIDSYLSNIEVTEIS